MTDRVSEAVEGILVQIARSRGSDPMAAPESIIVDSMDMMRLLVSLEERLDVIFDESGFEPFDLTSRPALIASIQRIISNIKVEK